MRTQGEIHEDKLAGMIRDSTLPFDGCTGVIKRLPHTVTLRFERPGEALIRIWGRRIGVDTPPLGAPTVRASRHDEVNLSSLVPGIGSCKS